MQISVYFPHFCDIYHFLGNIYSSKTILPKQKRSTNKIYTHKARCNYIPQFVPRFLNCFTPNYGPSRTPVPTGLIVIYCPCAYGCICYTEVYAMFVKTISCKQKNRHKSGFCFLSGPSDSKNISWRWHAEGTQTVRSSACGG